MQRKQTLTHGTHLRQHTTNPEVSCSRSVSSLCGPWSARRPRRACWSPIVWPEMIPHPSPKDKRSKHATPGRDRTESLVTALARVEVPRTYGVAGAACPTLSSRAAVTPSQTASGAQAAGSCEEARGHSVATRSTAAVVGAPSGCECRRAALKKTRLLGDQRIPTSDASGADLPIL